MAKPNYAFEKRQREIAKKKKKEEKAHRKEGGRPAEGEADNASDTAADAPADNPAVGALPEPTATTAPDGASAPAQRAPGA